MTITIGKCFSDHERLDKVVSNIETVNARIKEDTSIVDPTFILNTPGTVDFNYVTVPAWGRKYFVRNIIAMPGERVAVSCHVDVLSSFASGIRAAQAIVDKQESQDIASKYIDDGSYVMECRDTMQAFNFPNSFDSQANILITAGG